MYTYVIETGILSSKYFYMYAPVNILTMDHLLDWFYF